MKSSTTSDFGELYRALTPDARAQARKTYRLWRDNPRHPSLHFQRKGHYWSIRVSQGYRALGREYQGAFYWFWIGPHDEYERILSRR